LNKNAIFLGLVTIGALILALFLGMFVAEGDYSKLGLLAFISGVLTVCTILRANIWVLIPLCGAFTGGIGFFPGNIKVSELAILVAFGMFFVLSSMKAIPKLPRWNGYDKLLFLNLAYLATVYARNPAGMLVFQSDIIGGRPYFEIVIALLAYWVFQRVTLTPKQAVLIPVLSCVGAIGNSFLGAITAFSPGLAYRISPLYTGVTLPSSGDSLAIASEGDERQGYLAGYGTTVGSGMVAFFDPLRLFFFLNPLLSIIYVSAVVAILLSGFRSMFASLVALTALSVYFRTGMAGVARVGVVVIAALVIVITCQSAGFELPLPAQRALSFLPGSWDPRALSDAKASSEWRFEMWKQALTTDRYIHNKLLGDGFGFRIQDIQGFMSMGGIEATTPEQVQDYFLVTGTYHSGPVSTIRFVGAVGLFLFNAWMIVLARYAWQLIRRARNSPFFIYALYIGSPVIALPPFYWFVAGGYDGNLITTILALAGLNMIARSLQSYEIRIKAEQRPGILAETVVSGR